MEKGDLMKFVEETQFNNAHKWYKHKLESVLENETHKILCDFEIEIGQT